MAATCLAAVASSTPHCAGSDKAGRSDNVRLVPQMPARSTSTPPSCRPPGGIDRDSYDFLFMSSPITDGFRRIDYFRHRRKRELLEVVRVRHGHVLAGHTRDRRIQIVEGVLHHPRRDFSADAG